MMWVSATIFGLTAVFSLVIPETDPQEAASCGYADCIFEGLPKFSGVEEYIINLNFAKIPADIRHRCRMLVARVDNCTSFRTGCADDVSKPWSERLNDDHYLIYVMNVGRFCCERRNKLVKLRTCVTNSTDVAMKTCLGSSRNVNVDCVFEKFRANSYCTAEIDRFVQRVVADLDENPYIDRD